MSSRATSDPNPRLLDRRHVGAGTRASRGLLRQNNAAKVIRRAGFRLGPGSLACDLVTFVLDTRSCSASHAHALTASVRIMHHVSACCRPYARRRVERQSTRFRNGLSATPGLSRTRARLSSVTCRLFLVVQLMHIPWEQTYRLCSFVPARPCSYMASLKEPLHLGPPSLSD